MQRVKKKEEQPPELSPDQIIATLKEQGTIPSQGKLIQMIVDRLGVETIAEFFADEIRNGGPARREFCKMFFEMLNRYERTERTRLGDEQLKTLSDDQLDAVLKEKFADEFRSNPKTPNA